MEKESIKLWHSSLATSEMFGAVLRAEQETKEKV